MGVLELCSLGMGGVADPKTHALPHMFYHVKFGSSVTKVVRIDRREPPKLGSAWTPPLGVGAWLAPKNKPLPHVLPHQIW